MLAGACAQNGSPNTSSQPEIAMSQAALSAYNNDYLGRHLPLAFAVSPDGEAYSYYYCEASRCVGGAQPTQDSISRALNDCSNEGHGPCVLFATGRSAPRKYHLID
jgi:hypothetical protein